jgi:pimeloyl-ACP methyl ester carboxylesterase
MEKTLRNRQLPSIQWALEALLFVILILATLVASAEQSKEADVFIQARGDRLHFHILKGGGIPILFEAGGGDASTVWADIAKPIHDLTGTTLITYDRAGFGRSELNSKDQAVEKHGIQNGVEELEESLKQLGYNGKIMLVAHSYGALYGKLYAARHPALVKEVVFIDGSSACWFTEDWLKDFALKRQDEDKRTTERSGAFYQSENLPKTVEILRSTDFPSSIPVIDLVSEHPPFSDSGDVTRWKECHRQFVSAQPNRQGITAHGSGHYIYRDNPSLVIDAIIKAYSNIVDRQEALKMLRRYVDYALERANEDRRSQTEPHK